MAADLFTLDLLRDKLEFERENGLPRQFANWLAMTIRNWKSVRYSQNVPKHTCHCEEGHYMARRGNPHPNRIQ